MVAVVPEDRSPRIQPFGDGAILATFGDRIEVELSRRIGALVAALDARVAAGALPGVIDLVPSYTTLVASFDPRTTDGDAIGAAIRALWDSLDHAHPVAPTRTIEIPVLYGGQHGPDLTGVAAHTDLTPDEVIARHAAGTYVVGALGFSPGFAFLIGLDPALATPRRSTPRTAVPPGSVGIGGAQTGVYAQATPGGWSLIGRTPLPLTHPGASDPAHAFVMRAGDTIRFVPIDAAQFAELEAGSIQETAVSSPDQRDDPNAIAFTIVAPGLQTTVQDLGRPGLGRYGISPGGAADRASLIAANRAVGNPDGAATLEITLLGPTLRAERSVRIALAGADPGATVNGFPLVLGQPLDLRQGDTISFDLAQGSEVGVRTYLAVAGGIDVPIVMGSRATDLTAGTGGLEGRALHAGVRLRVGDDALETAPEATASTHILPRGSDIIIRVVRGPQAERFDGSAWTTFLHDGFTVSSQSNRMGVRLDGPSIMPIDGADLISEGMVTGAIQVTNGGQPIVMLPARATFGGYAKIATVITSDLDMLGQLRPGATVRFREVSVGEATAAARGEDGPEVDLVVASRLGPEDEAAIVALIRDFPQFGLVSLEVVIPATGVKLRLGR